MPTAKKSSTPASKPASTPASKPTVASSARPAKTASAAKKAPAKPALAPAPALAFVSAVKAAAPAKAANPAPAVEQVRTDKPKKPKLVRDSFTIPKAEYAQLDALKARALKVGSQAKKSEVLRAGIMALAGMSDSAFLAALGAVPAIKTGRPAKA